MDNNDKNSAKFLPAVVDTDILAIAPNATSSEHERPTQMSRSVQIKRARSVPQNMMHTLAASASMLNPVIPPVIFLGTVGAGVIQQSFISDEKARITMDDDVERKLPQSSALRKTVDDDKKSVQPKLDYDKAAMDGIVILNGAAVGSILYDALSGKYGRGPKPDKPVENRNHVEAQSRRRKRNGDIEIL